MKATWLKSPLFFVFCSAATDMPYTILHEFALFYLFNSWSSLYFIWQSTLLGQTWKNLDCEQKNELLVCILGSEVKPKIPDYFGDAPLPGTS